MTTFRIAAWGLLAGTAVQFYAAGWGVFGAGTFAAHAMLGYVLILAAVALCVIAAVARRPRRDVVLAVVLTGLLILQPVLALVVRARSPAAAALHVLDAFVIAVVAGILAVRPGTGDRGPATGQ